MARGDRHQCVNAPPIKENMKSSKRIKPAVKIACPQRGCSFTALPMSGVDVRRDDGGNECQGFDIITANLERNYQHQTFNLTEALSLSRGLDLDVQEVERLWKRWVREKLKSGEIIAVEGCYDAPVFKFR
jgi:hypothetical protein